MKQFSHLKKNNLQMHKTSTFCSKPFFEITLLPNGDVIPCCFLEEYVLGNIQTSTVLELWNSPKMQEFRSEFLNNNIITCKDHIVGKECHKFSEFFDNQVVKERVQTKAPLKLDLRLNADCNLNCIMCNVWMGENGIYTDDNFWNDSIINLFPYVDKIHLLGGEPFIQEDTYRLIDEVSKVNKTCKWTFTTNGNWDFTPRIKEYLDKIIVDYIYISMDGIFPETYLSIRKNGNYKQFRNTLESLSSYLTDRKTNPIRVDFCLQKHNYMEVLEFIRFCKKKNFDYLIIFLFEPEALSLLQLNKDDLDNFHKSIEDEFSTTKDEQLLRILLPLRQRSTYKHYS